MITDAEIAYLNSTTEEEANKYMTILEYMYSCVYNKI